MDTADVNDDENEVLYDATNIEVLDHYEIDEDASAIEIPADQINVMEYMEPSVSNERPKGRARKRVPSGRVVHIINRAIPSTSKDMKVFSEDIDDIPEVEDVSEVIEEPGTSVSRVFVTNDDSGMHMGQFLYSPAAERFIVAAQIIVSDGTDIHASHICRNVPQEFTSTGTFVVSMSNLANRSELSLDGLGPWGNPQGTSKFYKQRDGGQLNHSTSADYSWKILCNRYTHPGTDTRGMFYKKIYTGVSVKGVPSSLAVVVYEWVGQPHAISLNSSTIPHVAGIKERPFGQRAWEGRLEDIFRDECLSYRELPVFSRTCVDFETACRILLAHEHIQEERICSNLPQDFRECGTFVVDVAACGGEKYLCRDGRDWNKPSGSSRFFRTDQLGNSVRADINNTQPGNGYDTQVLLKRYETVNPVGLIRKIYVAKDKAKTMSSPLAVITYLYKAPGAFKTSVSAGRPVTVPSKKRPIPMEEVTEQDPNERRKCLSQENASEEDEMHQMRRKTLEMQADNQTRFSQILDRAERFFDLFEQSGSQILVPLTRQLVHEWRGTKAEAPY